MGLRHYLEWDPEKFRYHKATGMLDDSRKATKSVANREHKLMMPWTEIIRIMRGIDKPLINEVADMETPLRIVVYGGDCYVGNSKHCIHNNIIAWLVYYKKMPITEKMFDSWGSDAPTAKAAPFICLYRFNTYSTGPNPGGKFVTFAETYAATVVRLALLGKKADEAQRALDKIGMTLIPVAAHQISDIDKYIKNITHPEKKNAKELS